MAGKKDPRLKGVRRREPKKQKVREGPCSLRQPVMGPPEQAEALLCELLREMSTVPYVLRNFDASSSDELRQWWREHEKADAARRRRRRKRIKHPLRGGVMVPRREMCC